MKPKMKKQFKKNSSFEPERRLTRGIKRKLINEVQNELTVSLIKSTNEEDELTDVSTDLSNGSTILSNDSTILSNQSNNEIELVKKSLKELIDEIFQIKTSIKSLNYKQQITDINFKILRDNYLSAGNSSKNTNLSSPISKDLIVKKRNDFYKECAEQVDNSNNQIVSTPCIEFTDEPTYRLRGRFRPLRNSTMESINKKNSNQCSSKQISSKSLSINKRSAQSNVSKQSKSRGSNSSKNSIKPFSIKLIRLRKCVICKGILNNCFHNCNKFSSK